MCVPPLTLPTWCGLRGPGSFRNNLLQIESAFPQGHASGIHGHWPQGLWKFKAPSSFCLQPGYPPAVKDFPHTVCSRETYPPEFWVGVMHPGVMLRTYKEGTCVALAVD